MDISKYYDIIVDKIVKWSEDIAGMLPNFFLALIILFLFIVIAKLSRKLIDKILEKTYVNPALRMIILKVYYISIIILGCFTALSILKLEKTVTSLLAGAGIIGLALGFAFKDIATNFISGFFMAANQPFRVGDIIETGHHEGVVHKIQLRTTEITSFQGQQVIIPNREVFQNVLVNNTKNGKRRIDLEVGISYAEDLEEVRKIAISAVENVPHRIDEEIKLYFDEFSDSSIQFTLMVWVKYTTELSFKESKSEAIIAVKKAFNEKGITIPFPIRTLDFGIKGGQKLNAMLKNGQLPDEASGEDEKE